MKIITDCIYLPAQKPPKSCQDYTICSGQNDKYPFLIICDGCGSSKDSDIGARLLAHGAKTFFNKMIKNGNEIDYKNFGLASIVNANGSSKFLEIEEQCLDSTLIFSYVENNSYIRAMMFGDGIMFTTGKDGKLFQFKQISYKGNAPHYLSYNLNQDRYSKYSDLNGPVPVNIFECMSGNTVELSVGLEKQINFGNYINLIEAFIISSDGIESFIDVSTGERIPYEEVIQEIISFKTKRGEFIKRRIRRMMEDYAKKGIYNYDDVSIAAFMIEEE